MNPAGRTHPDDWQTRARLVRAVGDAFRVRLEETDFPGRVDHVWFTLDAGIRQPLTVSVNTWSRRNAEEGFDPRIRVARVRAKWSRLPPLGVRPIGRFDYGRFEARLNVFYETLDRRELEAGLIAAGQSCIRLEAIGAPYHRRRQPGIHQVHSRRSSCAVAENIVGLDGALKFYFPAGGEAAWWFFKFCGQP